MSKNLMIGGALVAVAAVAFMAGKGMSSAEKEGANTNVEVTPLAMVGDAGRGKRLFVSEGCVICHSINGVGGRAAPGLDAREWPDEVGAYDFAARMWRGAAVMGDLQRLELGYQIDLTGQELADLTSFSLDEDTQKTFVISDVPAELRVWFLDEIYLEDDLADRYLGEEYYDFSDPRQ